MLSTILGSTRFALGNQRSDTDFVDNLHTLITSNMLIAFALLSSFKMFGGRPVECMVPDDFTSSWEEIRTVEEGDSTSFIEQVGISTSHIVGGGKNHIS
uniref:Innexin n=1 Tax=Plectus sambesii TaxID=2011161 RepID=A0A914VJ64_9BILA